MNIVYFALLFVVIFLIVKSINIAIRRSARRRKYVVTQIKLNSSWHYAVNGQSIGPVSFGQILSMVNSGSIKADTSVIANGETHWRPLSIVAAELGHPLVSADIPFVPPPPPSLPTLQSQPSTSEVSQDSKYRGIFFAALAVALLITACILYNSRYWKGTRIGEDGPPMREFISYFLFAGSILSGVTSASSFVHKNKK